MLITKTSIIINYETIIIDMSRSTLSLSNSVLLSVTDSEMTNDTDLEDEAELMEMNDFEKNELLKVIENFGENYDQTPSNTFLCPNGHTPTKLNLSSDLSFENLTCFPKNFSNVYNKTFFKHSLFDFPLEEALEILLEDKKGYLTTSAETFFTICYVFLIIFGVVGNSMVGYVIWRKKIMRSARNLYIINLTLSDLTMCVISMPFTLIGLLYKDWSLGSVICKLIPVIQATNILVSTATIVAIAADRHFTIVRVGRAHRKKLHVAGSLGLIWAFSLIFTLPLYSYYFVDQVKLGNYVLFHRCMARWPSTFVKELWVVLLLITQYIFPILVLSLVHGSIKRYLGRHMTMRRSDRRAHREMYRNKRTTILLTTIALAFAVSWLPWHVVNLLADFNYSKFKDSKYFYTVFGSCHIIAMSSACFNPVLYGWLNTNLRRELLDFLPNFLKTVGCLPRLSYQDENISQTNKTNNNNAESPTRPPESITLFVYQPPEHPSPVNELPPITTAISLNNEIH